MAHAVYISLCEVFPDAKLAVDVVLALIQRRRVQNEIALKLHVDELKEACNMAGAKPRKRRKADMVKALVYQKCSLVCASFRFILYILGCISLEASRVAMLGEGRADSEA